MDASRPPRRSQRSISSAEPSNRSSDIFNPKNPELRDAQRHLQKPFSRAASMSMTASKSAADSTKTSQRFRERGERSVSAREPGAKPDARKKPGLLRRQKGVHAALPATPDTSELEPSVFGRDTTSTSALRHEQAFESGLRHSEAVGDAPSPSERGHGLFPSAVATPPIAEHDLEPVEGSLETRRTPPHLPFLNTAVASDASLPSPSLSPTIAAAQAFPLAFPGDAEDTDADSQQSNHSMLLDLIRGQSPDTTGPTMDVSDMIEKFDALDNKMKTFMMYQFLRRCNRKTINVLADFINPALKVDFLAQLPAELGLHVLSFLDFKDFCRAAQVSKKWRNLVNTNETGWKELFDRDGFVLHPGELQKAITQGWGWQDPCGPDAAEKDLSERSASPEVEITDASKPHKRRGSYEELPVPKTRNLLKRKRINQIHDQSKRRASAQENPETPPRTTGLAKYRRATDMYKDAGPMSAANAAAIAVPAPNVGLSSLRCLHLFKSLYRRHYMFKKAWFSDIEPHHMAFPAHPTNVITCLQFDDDKIITGSDDCFINVYDTKTGALRKKLEGHEGGVWALQYEGNVLVSGSTDRTVRVWDIEKGVCTQVFYGHTSTVRCLQIVMPSEAGKTHDGRRIMQPEKPLIITGSRDSQLKVWTLPEPGSKRYLQTGPPVNDHDCPYFVRTLHGHQHSVRAIAAHQDTLVSGSYDFTVRVWKISTGEMLQRLQGHTMKVYSVVLDHKRNRCISGSMDNFIKVWDLTTGACLYTLEGHSSLVGLLDLRAERLVSAAADGTLRIWDPEQGTCKSTLSAHTGAITCFQHDATKVISGSDRTLKLWDIKTGDCKTDLLTDLSGVWQVKFDERRVVAAVQRGALTFIEVSYSPNIWVKKLVELTVYAGS